MAANLTNQISTLKLSENCHTTQNGGIPNASSKLQERSLVLASKGKVAIVIVVDESKRVVDSKITRDSQFELLETLLCDNKRLVKVCTLFNILNSQNIKRVSYKFLFPWVGSIFRQK